MRRDVIAVIIGIGSYNDLGIIRSCGEAGVQPIYITNDSHPIIPIWKSKYLLETIVSEISEDKILSILVVLWRKYNKKLVVFPASDNAVKILDDNYNKLPKDIIISHAKGKIGNLMNKAIMANFALSAGLNVPRTIEFDLTTPHVDCILNYPLIIKPIKSLEGEKSDITICKNNLEFEKSSLILKRKGYKKILIQDYIHSETSREIGITGISYLNGEIEIHGYIDKIRNRSNINNFGKYFPNQELPIHASLKEFMRECGYIGIFDTDFIENDGKLYFIECNYRNGAYGYATTFAGFNMPLRWVNNCLGIANDDISDLRDVTFMEERTDFLNVLDKTMTFRSWLKDFINTDVCLFWNKRDIKPLLRMPNFIKKFFK